MSDSDDTDVLLLIPPDFFAVDSSDSEDSLSNHRDWFEGLGYASSNSRVDDLINQVNDLEERINLIESKENLNSDKYLSNHSHFNQAFDCAVSVDSTKFHNLGRSDLALRFYSMSSSGYRIGGESTDSGGIQCPHICLQGAPINVHNHLSLPSSPNPSVGPSYFTNRNSRNVSSFPAKRAIFLDTVSPQNVYTMSSTSDPRESSAHSVKSDMYNSDRIGNSILRYEWQDIGFLGEIDEFLEGRKKQSECTSTSQPTATSDEFCNATSENMQQVPNSNFGLHSFSNIPPNNSVIKPKVISPLQIQPIEKKSATMDLPQVSKLLSEIENTQKEIEYKLKYKGQLEGRDLSLPENGNGHFEQIISESDANQFSSQNCGLYQFMNTGTQISRPLESSSVILPPVETQPPPSISSNCTLNQDLSNTYHSNNVLLNQSSAKFQNVGASKEHAVSTSKHGAETYSESASTYNVDFNGRNPEVHHSFVQYPNVKSHIENDGSVRKQVSFETSKNLQRTDPISCRELGFDFQDMKLDEKMSFEPKKLSSFGCDSVSLPVHSAFPVTQSVCKQNRSVEVEPPTEYTDSQERNQHRSKEQIYEPSYNRRVNTRGEFTSQKDSAVSQSEFRAGRSEASGDLPKELPRVALTDSGHGLSVGTSSSSANLLSLSDLWGSETKLVRNEHMTVEQRLEEEKYRRQHCEDLIRHLQGRLLEEQQRLAVAVRVDRGKDQAILQLQDAWARLVAHWRELEEQRHHLAGQLSAQRSIHQQEMAEMAQKVKRYEQELSKVLDLAQGYKDKCDVAEQRRRETEEQHSADIHGLESKIQEGQHLLAETGRHIEEISQENISLKEKLKSAEEATLKEKQMLLKSQNEAKETSKKLNILEADIAALREENNSLQLRLKEERSRSNLLEQQKKTVLTSVEESKKKEKSLRDELKEKTDMVEKVKLDLRDYYQEQVEAVVREKLQEFQTQLDNAEASLQREMEERDKAASEAAAKQVQHITDKHQLEVRLLEEKHKEELQLYKLQLTQATQQISQLQVRLQSYSNKKTEIVEKLQGVMEAQWKEALRIISGSSPVVSSSYCHPRFSQGEKERGDIVPKMQPTSQFFSISQPNLDHHSASKSSQGYESHITHKTDAAAPFEIPVRDGKSDRVPVIHVSQSSEGSSTADEMPFGKEGQLTYRVSQPSKSQSVHMGKDHDLQKYIKMLLNRSPGYPVDSSITASSVSTSVSERKLPPDWDGSEGKPHNKLSSHCPGDISTSAFDGSKSSQVSSKDGRSSKPPWK